MIHHPLYPAPLKKGDTIGIIAPAGQMRDSSRFTKGVSILQEMGFKVKFPRDLWPGSGYLADNDQNRGLEFNELFSDSEVNGLICMRGGYGSIRMIDQIDLKQIINQPKIVIGFSDITILQNYLYQQTGLLSLHGPVLNALQDLSRQALERFYHCLCGKWHKPVVHTKIEVLRDGPGSLAPLVGGNLASLVTLLGTPYDFNWHKKIIFLEDINEPLYRIDRMLTQLYLAGKLANLSGLILGDFSLSSNQDGIERLRYKEQVWNIILELCKDTVYPVWANLPCGHCPNNLTLPLGAITEMNRDKKALLFMQKQIITTG